MESYFEVSSGVALGVSFPDRPQIRPQPPREGFLARPLTIVWDLAPILSWQPSYPSRVWSRDRYWRAPRAGTTVSPPFPPLIASGMRWEPTYPAPRGHQRRYAAARIPFVVGPSPSVFLTVAQRMGWVPAYPARVWSRRPSWAPASGITVVAPPILPPVFAAGFPCVDFANGTFTSPTFTTSATTAPTFLTPGLTRSTLINGAFC